MLQGPVDHAPHGAHQSPGGGEEQEPGVQVQDALPLQLLALGLGGHGRERDAADLHRRREGLQTQGRRQWRNLHAAEPRSDIIVVHVAQLVTVNVPKDLTIQHHWGQLARFLRWTYVHSPHVAVRQGCNGAATHRRLVTRQSGDRARGGQVVEHSTRGPIGGLHRADEPPCLERKLSRNRGPHLRNLAPSMDTADLGHEAVDVDTFCHNGETSRLHDPERSVLRSSKITCADQSLTSDEQIAVPASKEVPHFAC
mmetsp:Transcript_49378/g.88201  ORF Transcript_49378/g.88201 Transcript_49378/m.88201 type:complete len:254 (+) Transcript_49378:3284-4045(+)